jgi:hypothetical protein
MEKARAAGGRNIQSSHGRYLPPVGKVFQREKFRSDDVAKGQGDVLYGVFGRLRSPSKEMANATGLNERACRNQMSGVNCMNLADFFNACHAVPELADWGAKMMGLSGERQVQEISKGLRGITLHIEAGDGVKVSTP